MGSTERFNCYWPNPSVPEKQLGYYLPCQFYAYTCNAGVHDSDFLSLLKNDNNNNIDGVGGWVLSGIYLQRYKHKSWYSITEVPDTMAEAVQIPHIIAGTGYQQLMQDVVLWFSSTDMTSHLHFDNIQNLMCKNDS